MHPYKQISRPKFIVSFFCMPEHQKQFMLQIMNNTIVVYFIYQNLRSFEPELVKLLNQEIILIFLDTLYIYLKEAKDFMS